VSGVEFAELLVGCGGLDEPLVLEIRVGDLQLSLGGKLR